MDVWEIVSHPESLHHHPEYQRPHDGNYAPPPCPEASIEGSYLSLFVAPVVVALLALSDPKAKARNYLEARTRGFRSLGRDSTGIRRKAVSHGVTAYEYIR